MHVFSRISATAGLFVSLTVCAQDRSVWELGTQVPVAEAQRTINLTSGTRWVNVNQDEAIRFVAGGAEFGWRFDGTLLRPFDLRSIAPSGALTQPVTVYIRPRVSLRGV